MCGICGAIGLDGHADLDAMTASLCHRGPDSCGFYRGGPVELGCRRLAIIDPEGGDQPITNEDGDVVVAYNGETYNYPTLRAELRERGHDFTTDTDTEVFAHGYEEYGTDLFERLNGMFAVAIWDARTERLVLARDRFGVKPLSYARVDGGLLFGSEPKAVLKSGLIDPAVDPGALRYFLQLRYAPSTTTLFEGIETLPPATYLVAEPPKAGSADEGWSTAPCRYWRPPIDPDPPPDPATAVRTRLREAVERQLVSDVPVGFYLSGGLDTSSVVALASEVTEEPISTFCMGFSDSSWDERDDARAVADHFGTDHHEITIDGSFMRDFPEMIWHADEPKRNLYPWYVAREMRNHVTVALGGLGADELFGGYVYRLARLRELDRLRSFPESVRQTLRASGARIARSQTHQGDLDGDGLLDDVAPLANLDDPAALYVLTNSSDVLGDAEFYETRVFDERLQERTGTSPIEHIQRRGPAFDDESLVERARRYDLAIKLPDDFLHVEDRMSMAHSLESRVPFLDNALVDLALSLPVKCLLDADDSGVRAGKTVLRDAMSDLLPPAVFEKDKQGFTMPTLPFVRDDLLDHARCVLDEPYIVADGLVREAYLDELLGQRPTESLVPHYKLLWKLVGLEIWYQMYVVEGVAGPEPIEHYYT